MESSALSLIPPILALIMVIITRRVLISLGIGIIVGALMLNGFNPIQAGAEIYAIIMGIFFSYGDVSALTFSEVTASIVDSGFSINTWELFILLFLLLLGTMAALITRAGGSYAFGEWAMKRVKTRVGAQLLPIVLGIIIFIDDYFTSLTVGNVCRPLTDRHKISRAKLAYLVDSTAAPICVIAPVSSWGAYIIAIIAGVLTAQGVTEYEALQAFIMIIPMNYYAFVAIALVFAVAIFSLDFGSMKKHEERALQSDPLTVESSTLSHQGEDITESQNGNVGDLVWPILALIIGTVIAMAVTGVQGAEGNITILTVFENTDVAVSLVFGGLIGLGVALLLNGMKPKEPGSTSLLKTLLLGMKSMLPAIYILIFAWTIIAVIEKLGTGTYLASLVDGNINPIFLPVILFAIAGAAAFATGTSWGTFGLLLPIAGEMAAVIDISMLLPLLGAVLAGSIFGDHCSPISDTTILSATGAGCNHIDHVMTQLPYSLLAAGVTLVAYLVLGITSSVWLGLATAVILLILIILILRRKAIEGLE